MRRCEEWQRPRHHGRLPSFFLGPEHALGFAPGLAPDVLAPPELPRFPSRAPDEPIQGTARPRSRSTYGACSLPASSFVSQRLTKMSFDIS